METERYSKLNFKRLYLFSNLGIQWGSRSIRVLLNQSYWKICTVYLACSSYKNGEPTWKLSCTFFHKRLTSQEHVSRAHVHPPLMLHCVRGAMHIVLVVWGVGLCAERLLWIVYFSYALSAVVFHCTLQCMSYYSRYSSFYFYSHFLSVLHILIV